MRKRRCASGQSISASTRLVQPATERSHEREVVVVFVPVAAVVSGALFADRSAGDGDQNWLPSQHPSRSAGATNPRAPGDDAPKSKHLVVPSLCRAWARNGKTPAVAGAQVVASMRVV
jgi:hypothetical protein